MKPLAILKDSLREAWDSKILLVLIIFSIVMLVFVASFSFVPAPPDEALNRVQKEQGFRMARADHGKADVPLGLPIDYAIEDFKEVRKASNPAEGEYEFTVKATGHSLKELKDEAERQQKRRNKGKIDDAKDKEKDKEDKDKKKDPDPKAEEKAKIEDDTFVMLAAIWHLDSQDAGKLSRALLGLEDPKILDTIVTRINDDMLEVFIREKLEFHLNMSIAKCVRKPGPMYGTQEFVVTTAPSDPRSWPHDVQPLFGAFSMKVVIGYNPLGVIIWWVEDKMINGYGAAIAILFGIIVTAFFIPNMLRKGTVDLMISKPIGRVTLLVYKYLGGLSFMLVLASVNVLGAWIILGVRSGIWNPKFLLVIPVLTFTFAIFYALSTLIGVVTRSIIACILVTIFASGFLYLVAFAYSFYEQVKKFPGLKDEMPAWLDFTAETLHTCLPRTDDLDRITTKLIAECMTDQDQTRNGLHVKTYPSWAGTIIVSLLWIVGLMGLACWRFAKKDY
jgi:ABC-type transport system involved in multi-copper enzyme maturation permease subunit